MRIGVLGTGHVGQLLASRWVALGHEVVLGSRSADNPAAREWAAGAGELGRSGTFAQAVDGADLVVNATAGQASHLALEQAGSGLDGKVVLDVANDLDFSDGFPPAVGASPSGSLVERLQAQFPGARFVKALNTMAVEVMVDPFRLAGGEHDVFVSGDDAEAKALVVELLHQTGWRRERIRDLGGLETARGTELLVVLWLTLMQREGTNLFSLSVVR